MTDTLVRGCYVERIRVQSRTSRRRTPPTAKKPKITSKQRLASQIYNLSLDVSELRQQIQHLAQQRAFIAARALATHRDADGSAFKQALAYFTVFSRGYRAADATPPKYLEAVADDTLSLGVTGLGRDTLLEQWRRYTAYFGIRFYNMHTVRVVALDATSSMCIVRGEGEFHGSFTLQALETAFPMVLKDTALTQELLGRAMVTPVAFILHFNEHGRMVRHDGEVDWFVALTRVLGDPVRAAAIMEDAQLAEEDMVYAVDECDHEPPIEPAAQAARAKRTQLATDDDAVEPEAEIAARQDDDDDDDDDDADVDARHSVGFLLS